MIYLVEDDKLMADCITSAISAVSKTEVRHFSDVVAVVQALSEGLPDLIFLDVLLTGPDGFTLLNELVSYPDTAKIPVVIVSSLDFSKQDLSAYHVVGALNKETMVPSEIQAFVKEYVNAGAAKN